MQIRQYFDAIVSANDVVKSKPHPETFLKCATLLALDQKDCLVFEDTPKGVECAMHAGIKAVVILGEHQKEEFDQFTNVIHFANDYTQLPFD
jgi:beta-phosphoglucomutase-like phosphatase (HAD superfamily)